MRIEESLNVTFDESLSEPKSPHSVEDDRIIEPVVQNPVRSSSLEANASEPGYPKSLKEARGHPIEQVIGELNERTLSANGDNVVISKTSSEEMRTRIYNIKIPPSLIRGIGEDKIWDQIENPLSPNHIKRSYSICCENTINMINSIKDLREENRDMLSSINEATKLMLVVATNMSCVVKNNIRKEESKDNLKE
ncbi:hypothetical protein Tco_0610797 [Tanacetum coccineum]